jgi:hypothetical protein
MGVQAALTGKIADGHVRLNAEASDRPSAVESAKARERRGALPQVEMATNGRFRRPLSWAFCDIPMAPVVSSEKGTMQERFRKSPCLNGDA